MLASKVNSESCLAVYCLFYKNTKKTKGIALMARHIASDIVIAGGGLAGIVTALEALRAGKTVTIVDRDTPERLGGLALWAFGGMALIETPLQRRMKIADSPERAQIGRASCRERAGSR